MKPHSFDRISLLAGFVVIASGLIFLIPAQPGDVAGFVINVGVWFWAVLFLAIGMAVILPVMTPKAKVAIQEVEQEEHTE
ncbi:MAG: hypothetical protein QGD89_09340 [Actinomycetota bacterium]|nr:hypothetical protein [Actinomycetota bacterium]